MFWFAVDVDRLKKMRIKAIDAQTTGLFFFGWSNAIVRLVLEEKCLWDFKILFAEAWMQFTGRFNVSHPGSREQNFLRTFFKLYYFLNDVRVLNVWILFKERTFGDTFNVVSWFIRIYAVVEPEIIDLLKISRSEFAVPIIWLIFIIKFVSIGMVCSWYFLPTTR